MAVIVLAVQPANIIFYGGYVQYYIVSNEIDIGVSTSQKTSYSGAIIKGEGVPIGNTTLVTTAQIDFATNVQKNAALQVGQKSRLNSASLSFLVQPAVYCRNLIVTAEVSYVITIARSSVITASQGTSKSISLTYAVDTEVPINLYVTAEVDHQETVLGSALLSSRSWLQRSDSVQSITSPELSPAILVAYVKSIVSFEYLIQTTAKLTLVARNTTSVYSSMEKLGTSSASSDMYVTSEVEFVPFIEYRIGIVASHGSGSSIAVDRKIDGGEVVDWNQVVTSEIYYNPIVENTTVITGGNYTASFAELDEAIPPSVSTGFYVTAKLYRNMMVDSGMLCATSQNTISAVAIEIEGSTDAWVQQKYYVTSTVESIPSVQRFMEVGTGQKNEVPPPDLFDIVPFTRCINAPSDFVGGPTFYYNSLTQFMFPIVGMKTLIYLDVTTIELSALLFVSVGPTDVNKYINLRMRVGSTYSNISGFFLPGPSGSFCPPIYFGGGESGWVEIEIEAQSEALVTVNEVEFKGLSVSVAAADPYMNTSLYYVTSEVDHSESLARGMIVAAENTTSTIITFDETAYVDVSVGQYTSTVASVNQPRVIPDLLSYDEIAYSIFIHYMTLDASQYTDSDIDLLLKINAMFLDANQFTDATVSVYSVARSELSVGQYSVGDITLVTREGTQELIQLVAEQVNGIDIELSVPFDFQMIANQSTVSPLSLGLTEPLAFVLNQLTGFYGHLVSRLISSGEQKTDATADIVIGKNQIDSSVSQYTSATQSLSADDASIIANITESIASIFTPVIFVTISQESSNYTNSTTSTFELLVKPELVGLQATYTEIILDLIEYPDFSASQNTDSPVALGSEEPIETVAVQSTGVTCDIEDGWGTISNQLSSSDLSLFFTQVAFQCTCVQSSYAPIALGSVEPLVSNGYQYTIVYADIFVTMPILVSSQNTSSTIGMRLRAFSELLSSQFNSASSDLEVRKYFPMDIDCKQVNGSSVDIDPIAYSNIVASQTTSTDIGLYRDGDEAIIVEGKQNTAFEANLVRTTVGVIDKPDVIYYDMCEIN